MFIRVFDIPKDLRTEELCMFIRRAIAEKFWLDPRVISVSLSPLPTSDRGPHGVLITGLAQKQMWEYRTMVEVIGSACAPYFHAHGYLWYGCQNPYLAGLRDTEK